MQNILKFTRRETLIGGDHENKDADTVTAYPSSSGLTIS